MGTERVLSLTRRKIPLDWSTPPVEGTATQPPGEGGRIGRVTDLCLAIDLGTSGAKVALVNAEGDFVATETATYSFDSPAPGWAEIDPRTWLDAVAGAVRGVRTQAPGRIVALGLDGQMHGLVIGQGRDATRPAILWPDSRARDQMDAWGGLAESLRGRLANPLVPGMFGPMLGWLRQHEPQNLAAAAWACSPKDWLRLQLVDAEVVTDPSDASATLAWDATGAAWHQDLLDELGIGTGLLPQVMGSAAAHPSRGEHGIEPGIPCAVGCADTAATLLATQLQPGEVLVNLGTGIQICVPAPSPELTLHPTVHSYMDAQGDWYAMVAPQNGGLALTQVLRLLDATWEELYASLDQPGPPPGGPHFNPWFAPERLPRWRTGDAAGWSGLGLATTRADLLRTALESVAFQIHDALRALPTAATSLRFAGGGTRDPRMRQLICDVAQLPGRRSTISDATALGAARLGFQAAGTTPSWPVPVEADMIEPRHNATLLGRRDASRLAHTG